MARVNDGKDLELAVGFIERLTLGANAVPAGKLTIEPRKVVVTNIDGLNVKDEVDLFVRIENAPGYEEITIFECRDRNKPVDKNDIDAFKAKMRRLGVSNGIFVARKFTSGARAVAAERPIVKLHTFENSSEPLMLSDLEAVAARPETFRYSLRAIGLTSPDKTQPAVFRGKPQLFEDVLEALAHQAAGHRSTVEFGQPEQVVEFHQTFVMRPGEMTVSGFPVQSITVEGTATVMEMKRTRIVSINVEGRGRSVQHVYTKPDGKEAILFESEIPSPLQTHRRAEPKLGRNDLCPCGSGKKVKKCHPERCQ